MNSNRKGKDGELELVRELAKYGFECRRGVQYNGADGSPDLIGLTGIHPECKRVEALNLTIAMNQAVTEHKEGFLPVVFHRKSKGRWMATMELSDWVRIYWLALNDLSRHGRINPDGSAEWPKLNEGEW